MKHKTNMSYYGAVVSRTPRKLIRLDTCPRCGGTYTGNDWRRVDGDFICPDCANKKDQDVEEAS